jgi:glucose/arabinose dehydrogenase
MRVRTVSIVVIATFAFLQSYTAYAQSQAPNPAPPAPPAPAQPLPPGQTSNPFPQPIIANQGIITVRLREFASLPDIENIAARAMTLVEEPGTRRLFVSEMRGVLYAVSMDGRSVAPYIDLRDPRWSVAVQSVGRERGLQAFAFHPQFAQGGAPGYGKFYTWMDIVANPAATADFTTASPTSTHDTVMLEWTARNAAAATYDGAAPRELFRLRQPFANHNGGMIAFNATARPGTPEFGLLYVGVGDGGSGGDPMNQAQNLGLIFGKILRIDPLGRNSRNGKYGIPAGNPFVGTAGALPEIYAYGIRNSQGFSWDPRNGAMYMSDIGQNIVEEVSPVTAGANLGWNIWEGSYRFVSREAVIAEGPRSDPKVTYPIVEWDQFDPVLLPNNSGASVGALVYRSTTIPQLNGRLLFGDMPSGELFHVSADNLPRGGQDAIRRVLFVAGSETAPRPLLAIIQEKNRAQGKTPAARSDMRFFANAAGQIFLLNKADGTIRVIER